VILRVVTDRNDRSRAPAGFTAADGRSAAAGRALREKAAPKPPMFHEGTPVIQDLPGAPGYDPTKFMHLVSQSRVFEAEPRDPRWAPAVEAWMNQHLARDLSTILPEAKVTVECRLTTCRWTWQGSDPQERIRWLQRTLYMGSVAEQTGTNELTITYYGDTVGFKGLTLGDPDGLFERLEQRRAKMLGIIREGRRAYLDEYIPRAAWPAD
jgi:hypothetical protein